jgi:hypothetical protein
VTVVVDWCSMHKRSVLRNPPPLLVQLAHVEQLPAQAVVLGVVVGAVVVLSVVVALVVDVVLVVFGSLLRR